VPELLRSLFATPLRIGLVVSTTLFVVGVGVAAWRVYRRRRARTMLEASICAVGLESLRDRLVPDGMGGTLHAPYLLLTPRGVVVVDLWDVAGNIFGSDQMEEWTVMAGSRRSTFLNPQPAMYDRVAAVKVLAGEMPVEGRMVFTRRGTFPKGLPRWTLSVESLRLEFPPMEDSTADACRARYRDEWAAVVDGTTSGPHKQSASFLQELFLG
jgi:hypothetical protein